MNKELFVSSTPHETKVGMVEDDLLAEIYLERENEYTLAGSIYKGRVTRVLPGMQSAFVDIGLERDAFLYVSDFMDLEEHDDDLTEVIPANRGVQDMRQQAASSAPVESGEAAPGEIEGQPEAEESSEPEGGDGDSHREAAEGSQPSNGGDASRDRGSWRGGRRRRRGGRRDRFDRGTERSAEPRYSRPAEAPSARPAAGPPSNYQPILLPGESISKYQRFSQQPAVQEDQQHESAGAITEASTDALAPLAETFPEDEPIFAAGETVRESIQEEQEPVDESSEEAHESVEEPVESASTTSNWNREFRRTEDVSSPVLDWAPEVHTSLDTHTEAPAQAESVRESEVRAHEDQREEETHNVADISEPHARSAQVPAFAAPGTMEEETIEDEEADTVRYESSSDEGYDEFEEETHAAGQPDHLNGDAREAVTEIHEDLMAESGIVQAPEATPAEGEEDSEEMELEEAQAQAEALLDA